VLAGVTRGWVLEHAPLPVEERALMAEELSASREAFLTSSVAGVIPLLRLNGRPIGDGAPGPITLAIQRSLDQHWARPGNE
jgi:branched-subunit amino acid aminotransferase/4-amino-4-deoxychorismate lyase